MKKIILILFIFTLSADAYCRDSARDLRRMIGFSIIAADTVDQVMTGKRGEKYLKLGDGTIFKVEMMILDPLSYTDVIVFAKAPSKALIEQYKGKLPESALYQFKLLIENEAYDAAPIK